MEKRMKVFDATMEFIVYVLQKARMEELQPLYKFNFDTRDHQVLFGNEIHEYLDELYSNGVRLHAVDAYRTPEGVMRPEDIPVSHDIVVWFSDQTRVARDKFLKYVDFREP